MGRVIRCLSTTHTQKSAARIGIQFQTAFLLRPSNSVIIRLETIGGRGSRGRKEREDVDKTGEHPRPLGSSHPLALFYEPDERQQRRSSSSRCMPQTDVVFRKEWIALAHQSGRSNVWWWGLLDTSLKYIRYLHAYMSSIRKKKKKSFFTIFFLNQQLT